MDNFICPFCKIENFNFSYLFNDKFCKISEDSFTNKDTVYCIQCSKILDFHFNNSYIWVYHNQYEFSINLKNKLIDVAIYNEHRNVYVFEKILGKVNIDLDFIQEKINSYLEEILFK